MTTAFVLALALAVIATSVVLTAWLLWIGGRLARIPDATFRRAVLAAAVISIATAAFQVLLFANDLENRAPLLAVGLILGQLALTWVIIQEIFRTSFGRAILAWLPTLVGGIVALAFIALVVQPFLIETYEIPTNGMAPTIAGEHFAAACPHCQAAMVVSVPPPPGPAEELGICIRCFRMSRVALAEKEPLAGDRIVTLKFLEPRRWDVIVFRVPSDPAVNYVQRLVGLPGEEVAIRDGELVIDGKVLPKPGHLAGLTYAASPFDQTQTEWGPVQLGDDEYFVLGDFTLHSADARTWHVGAKGHPAYALPKDHLVGVVTHIYWPPSRWRVLR